MKLRISRWIFFAVIISSFFIMIYGRHVGGPWVLFEFLVFFNISEIIDKGDFAVLLHCVSVTTGQLLFLYLGWRTVTGYKLWGLLIAPLLVTIPLIFMLTELGEFQKQTTNSAIPFFIAVVIFYIECIFKLTKNRKQNITTHE